LTCRRVICDRGATPTAKGISSHSDCFRYFAYSARRSVSSPSSPAIALAIRPSAAYRLPYLLIISRLGNNLAMKKSASSLEEVEEVFMALSHEARRHILLLLSHRGGELPSGYLAKRFQHSWPTTTRHLGVLEKAGLVEVRRKGRSSHYRINRERVLRVVGGWLGHLDPPTPQETWASSGPKSTDGLANKQSRSTRRSKSKGT